jgi:hypothetical protein
MTHELRRTAIASLTAGVAAALAVTATFHLLLRPAESVSCNTSLLDSTFKTALVPVHLAAAALLSGCLLALGARRAGGRPDRATSFALGAVWAYALGCVIEPALFGPTAFLAVIAAPTLGIVLLVVLAIRALAIRRSARSHDALWLDHARSAQVALWAALVLGVPASLSYAWLSGAHAFCF